MNQQKKPISIKDKILTDIKSGEITMRPKIYFTLKIAALVLGTFAVVVISIFIFNFILFTIRISGQDNLLGFGPRGWEVFVRHFPWHLLVLDVALIIGLQWLLRQFKFGYKIPILYLLLGLLCITSVAGFALDRGTPFNDRLYQMRGQGLPPPLGGFYGRANRPPPLGGGVCRCTIMAISGNVLTVQDNRSTSTLSVILPANDPRATTTSLKVGDMVLVAGDQKDGVINAFGVRKISPDDLGPRRFVSPR